MDVLGSLLDGFSVAFAPANLLYVVIGVSLGMIIGVLPGLGPAATIALLLPITFGLDSATAIIMLAGIYYGAYYGGTITSVLLRLPGEAASVVTAIDGYEMARQGRAGAALGISAIGSFIGGLVAVVGMVLIAPPLADIAVGFGPPEYVALAAVGLLLVTYLGTRSFSMSIVSALLGLFLALVGTDPITGGARFTLGIEDLRDGLNFVPIAMGLFGIGEVLFNLEGRAGKEVDRAKVGRILPTRADLRTSSGAITRGSLLGFLIGVLPGGGGVVSSLTSYGLEKRVSKHPDTFGRGAIQGVAGPETANNASSTSAFIPLLTLGLPSNGVLALIFGALLLQGVTPGPELISSHPDIFWGVIASMVLGNVVLLVLNLPLVGVFVQLLKVPVGVLAALTVLITMIGVFSVRNNVFDMYVVLAFGALGYLMRKSGLEPGPLVLAFVLGPIMETSFRQAMLISNGDPAIFVTRPVSGTLLGLAALALLVPLLGKSVRGRRKAGEQSSSRGKAGRP
ncbi:tripartite tricarboxylate transporter permease [Qaidamihabitans albus]|uniref:tripartite tricarboxylate transporter permease n=1 Tax=Qaidamihabitans albus TaxID=2795733 RepID=UPI0018F25B5B|nr:tripartite tricarboxylate transporter permease [Qaidamihabitans albus]